MKTNSRKLKNNSELGQTFMIVVIVMIIALTVGVTVSTRFIKNLRTITQSDDLAKATGVAEALIEKILIIPSSTLSGYIDNNNCDTDCLISITDTTGQILTATATLSYTGNSQTSYEMSLTQLDTQELTLSGYATSSTLDVCWDGGASIEGSYISDSSGTISATTYAYNSAGTTHGENNFSTAAGKIGYESCFEVQTSDLPKALRLRSVYEDTDVFIIPAAGETIPVQGILIKSIGKAGSAVKTINVLKSTAFTPSVFDYTLYQKIPSQTLSN